MNSLETVRLTAMQAMRVKRSAIGCYQAFCFAGIYVAQDSIPHIASYFTVFILCFIFR